MALSPGQVRNVRRESIVIPHFGVSKNKKATEVIPRWPFVLQVVAGEHFEKYWTEENLQFEAVELGKDSA